MQDAFKLSSQLRPFFKPRAMFLWQGKSATIKIEGMLNLSHANIVTKETAHITLTVFHDWDKCPPLAIANDYWVKKGVEWHAGGQGGPLCYVFDGHWKGHLEKLTRSGANIAEHAAAWCAMSLASLLYKHLYAYENGVKAWSQSWDEWPHNPIDAYKMLEKLKKQGYL